MPFLGETRFGLALGAMNDLERLVAGLSRTEAYPHPAQRVDHIETHISHVFLAGDYAYKLKKPLSLGFLDFSTLERRRFYCEEELRLNRRLAPRTYLSVVPVTGSLAEPRMEGAGDVLEYAVKMRRFDQAGLLTRLPLDGDLPELLAERVAAFHQSISSVDPSSEYGSPGAVLAPMLANFEHIRTRVDDPESLKRLGVLEDWTRKRSVELRPILSRRRSEGFVRECHGDMHRGNIALDGKEILIFDGIEFNPSLRWIDTMSELAFLAMDLEDAGEVGQARRVLNRYLELTGDYEGILVLDFYKVYRAMVRAKVIAIRLGQPDLDPREAVRDRRELAGYLDLAEAYRRPRRRYLYLTHGFSGSGKSRACMALRAKLPLIHIRSDIERKRLFGLPAAARTRSGEPGGGIYGADAGRRTYERLAELAGTILDAGYSPLVDATFLRERYRALLFEIAKERGVVFRILAFHAPEIVLRRRILNRAKEGKDPSEAGIAVLEHQLANNEPLTDKELEFALTLDSERGDVVDDLVRRLSDGETA
jgi:aminoglycoside phosphotransferase family enzyme/predicted kinase